MPSARFVTAEIGGDAQPGVARDDHLGHRAHADEVGAERAEGADLGGRLEARPGDREVDAVVQLGAERVGGGVQARAQLGVVGAGEAGEARADGVVVRADQRVEAEQVDVVGEADEAARADLRRAASRRRWSARASSAPSALSVRIGVVIALASIPS